MNYYNNLLDFLGKPILKNNKIFKTSQNRINYYNTDVNKINNIYPKPNYKNNHLYQISTSIPLFNLKENSYRRYHQSLNKEIKFYSNAIKNNNIIFNRPISNIESKNYKSIDLIVPSYEKKNYDNLFIRKNNFFNAYLNNYHNRKKSINNLFDNNEGYFNF